MPDPLLQTPFAILRMALASLLTALLVSSCQDAVTPPQESEETKLEEPTPAPSPSMVLPTEISFNEHIQPILSENCYQCHGPDEKTRYPEDSPLRLDLAEEAFAPRENGEAVIIKGEPEASLLVQLIHSEDAKEVMPPPDSHKELKPRQIALLEQWVEEGAEYQEHWSFLPITRPTLPSTEDNRSSKAIDHFAGAKLAAAGMEPNPPEDTHRFYRRLCFDLTGLPPTPEETATFTWDKLESEVDRLLATPASAEHFTRHWLDAARYADTHGIHIDNYRAIWPYRDWVLQAFAQNMPWDQFTIEQIAGDLLPTPSLDQTIATGFNRCLPTTGEGGAIGEEYLAIYAQDRTSTTGAVWLGLTLGCAACHDHKFDPITTVDNYSFNAFFRNTTMSALDGNKAEHPPNIFVPLSEDRSRQADLPTAIQRAKETLAARRKAARPAFQQWLATAKAPPALPTDPTLSIHLPFAEKSGPLHGQIDGKPLEWPSKHPRIKAPLGYAPVISHSPLDLGDHGSFSRTDAITLGGFVWIEGKPNGAIIARMNPDTAHRGWDLYLQAGRPAAHVIDTWPGAANKLVANKPLAPGKWHHVMATFDGSKPGSEAQTIYLNGAPVASAYTHQSIGPAIETPVPLRLGSRSKNDSKLTGGKVALQDFRLYRRLLSPEEIKTLAQNNLLQEILSTPDNQRTKEQKATLYDHYLTTLDSDSIKIEKEIISLQEEEKQIRSRGSVSLVMKEKDNAEPFAHVLERGLYSDKGERVLPATPASLPPMPEDAPRNRLGLAQWLVSKENPLTARVTMNRLWHQFFGTGIVETVEDFGIMGAQPSHPRLLDWLAAEFMESGWDHRHMVKAIVTSATYQQSGRVSAQKLEADPENRLLSRGPRYRLDAEQIRDLALFSSGLLVDKTGGPSVKPYQPKGVWSAVAMKSSNTRNYKADTGESLYRRSLYTFWKRTAPHPAMEILNAPTREVFCVRRERTNTPLQAFVTLNDPQFVEAARRLAERAIQHTAETGARLDFISTRVLSRTLEADERALLALTLETAQQAFTADQEAAKSLIATGASKPDATLDPSETASWTLLASQLINLDETLTK